MLKEMLWDLLGIVGLLGLGLPTCTITVRYVLLGTMATRFTLIGGRAMKLLLKWLLDRRPHLAFLTPKQRVLYLAIFNGQKIWEKALG
jgi:hypothetical protein